MISGKHYLFVMLLLFTGLVASLLLVPSRKEVALMEMKDKHFEEARKGYEEQLAQGTMTIVTANHLADLYLQSGEVDKAIALMEKFSAANPTHAEARAKLGTLYQYAQRQDSYLLTLEETNRQKPTQETLKALSDIYNFNGQYDKQAAALKQMIEAEHGKNEKSFTDLADIQAVGHDYAGAAATLKDFRKQLPDKFGFRDVKLMVSLLFDANQPKEAAETAEEWVKANNNAVQGAQLINILHFRDSALAANALLANFSDDQINGTDDLLEEYILIALDLGKEEEVYRRLKTLYEAGRLTMAFNGRLLLLAAAQGDKKLTAEVLAHTDLNALADTQLLALAESSVSRDDAGLLASITHAFSTGAARDAHPLLAAALAISNHENDADARLAQLDNVMLPQDQLLQMASICVHAKQNACATHFLGKLPAQDTMNDTDIASIGALYLDMQEWEKGYAWLQAAQQRHPSPAIEAMIVQFAAARGDDAQLKAWLDKAGNTATGRALEDIYFTAEENHHPQTALIIAEFLHARENSEKTRNMLIDAYLKLEQFEPVAALLRDIHPKSKTDEDNYLAALVHLAPASLQYHKELTGYAMALLHSDAPIQRKMDVVYLLMDAKAADIAVPMLRDMAQTADEKQKRAIAYILLDQGYKADGEAIIMALAAHAAPDSKDVKELLYIWGPKPSAEQMAWLETRFSQASGKERDAWADIIGNAASSDFVLGFAERHPDSIGYPAVAGKYFQALADNGTFASKLDESIASGNIAWLHGYGRAAIEHGFRREARKAYEAIVALAPSDMIALREAGTAASERADYAASERYLGQYVHAYHFGTTSDPDAWRAFFYYAELQRHNRQLQTAKSYYSDVYDLLSGEHNPTPDMLLVKAQSLVWMGDTEGGLTTLAQAHAHYPDDNGLRADSIGILADLKQYDEARKLLPASVQSLANLAPKAAAPAQPPALASDVTSYTLLEHDSQLLLHLAKPEKYAKRLKGVPWIGYVNEGYDTLLIAANPGYKIIVDDAARTVSAVAGASSSESQDVPQIRLRYELLAARIDMETGHIYAATQRLVQLLAEHPHDVQVLSLASSAENAGGNWPRAGQLLAEARTLAPQDSDLAQQERKYLRRLNAPNVTLDQEFVHLGSDRESIQTLSGYINAASNAQLGMVVQNNDVDTRKTRLSDGSVGTFSNVRQRSEVYGQWDGENGQLAKGSLFANDDKAGFGGYYSFLDTLGQTALTAEWHKPYWEYAEAVVDEATRDRVAVVQTVKPDDRLTISGGPGLNRYNAENKDNVVSAATLEGNVSYRLIEGQPFLDLGYGLDGEYVGHTDKSIDSTGNLTRMLPIVSHEIHALTLGTGYQFCDDTYADAQAGYAYDRMNGHGPLLSGKLTHELNDDFDMQLHAMYGYSSASSNANNTATRFGASIRWRF